MTSEDGDTFMLKAGPSTRSSRTNTVDEPVLLVARASPTAGSTSAARSTCSLFGRDDGGLVRHRANARRSSRALPPGRIGSTMKVTSGVPRHSASHFARNVL